MNVETLAQAIERDNVEFFETKKDMMNNVTDIKDVLYVVKSDEDYLGGKSIYIRNTDGTLERINDSDIKQHIVTGVVAPKDVVVNIPYTSDHKLTDINVLKIQPGQANVTTTLSKFDAIDAASFEPNPFVEFNSGLRLKKNYEIQGVSEQINDADVRVFKIDKSLFKDILNISIL